MHRWPYGSLLQISLRLGSPTPSFGSLRLRRREWRRD
jgi:hypothetical protein